MSSRLIIRTCHHILPDGRHCQGAAVRGRACRRHHLDAVTRLHNMARAQRRTVHLRWRVPESLRDLALNRTEVNRILATGRIGFHTARMIFWALDLTASALPARPAARLRRAHNPNVSYHVPVSPLLVQGCIENPSQVPENTKEPGEGVPPQQRAAASQIGTRVLALY
jgi:hypothetical protein